MLHHMATIWFSMVAIFASKYKNPPIWAKFGFQVDYDVANLYPSFGSHIISYLVVFAPFLIMSPKRSFRRHIVFALFLILTKTIVSEWPPFSNWPPTKLAKFQCSLISTKIDIHFLF